MQVGVDTGGTFTDLVTADGRVAKVLSTPDDPGRAIRTAVDAAVGEAIGEAAEPAASTVGETSDPTRDAVGEATGEVIGEAADARGDAARLDMLAHGTTVATNALLERRGARVALVTTEGLRDVIEIARQDRPSLYDQLATRPEPLVPRHLRYEVDGRLDADGAELTPVDAAAVPVVAEEAAAVAVCLLHADIQPAHERVVAAVLRDRGHDVTCSHDVSPEMREVERTITTVINASLRPRCRDYLRGIDDLADEVLVMTSAGGLVPAGEAAELPAALLLSGPAGGVRAGAAAAAANGYGGAITFDMGGTSTDVCLILDGAPAPAAQREVGGFTVRFPSLDVHTIGAGGGSIARIDPGGALVVGPQSAGADPGPACYGRGGEQPTVTDANLVAGRIPAAAAFGGLRLDRDAAAAALARAGVSAEGVLAVVDANMERALRSVSVERGVDPRELALVAFGGAGPLHACALAEALDMPAVVVPARAGVLSAVGLLTAPRRRDLVRSWADPTDHTGLAEALRALADRARALVAPEPDPGVARPDTEPDPDVARPDTGLDPVVRPAADPQVAFPAAAVGADAGSGVTVTTALDCRYRGQSHELTVPSIAAFHDEHRRRNGYARPDDPVEVVAIRATASRPPAVDAQALPTPSRLDGRQVVGPAVVAEADCTIWVADGWTASEGAAGAIVVRRTGEGR
ncbi:MAG TPA: hydantoinase/oxoprolinase family protein [Acidimicrobiales bacterium]|nr:hydantoinase/oxoprolinase family protein [Acidimicrobiales bacterium]